MVAGRPIRIVATDGRVLRGTLGQAGALAATRCLAAARQAGQPVVLLLDSDGARPSEGLPAVLANSDFLAALADLGGHVPRLGALFGAAGGSAAYALALTDLAVGIAERSFAFVAGPAVVAQAIGEEVPLGRLGGTAVHTRSGLLPATRRDDAETIAWLQQALGYLPDSAATLPPRRAPCEPREVGGLARLFAGDPKKAWALERLLAHVVDADSWHELGAAWGPSVRTGLARVAGRALLVVASSPGDLAGAIDALARKLARMLRFASAFNLPILTLCDTPGFLPGSQQEAAAILCHGAAVIAAYCEARRSVPRVAVVLRRAIGAGSVLAAEADLVLALPGAVVAQMGPAALAAAAKAAGVFAAAVGGEDAEAEAAGFAHRTVAAEFVRAEIVSAFERLPAPRPAAPGTRKAPLFPL
jgi:acetyl-CoA carboxylase carboxyltransferase component